MTRLLILAAVLAGVAFVLQVWRLDREAGRVEPPDPWQATLADPVAVEALRRGLADLDNGRLVPLSVLRREMGGSW